MATNIVVTDNKTLLRMNSAGNTEAAIYRMSWVVDARNRRMEASFGKDMNGVDLMIEMFFGIDDACKVEVMDLAAYGKKFNPFRLVHREPPGGQS
jgi:hypothetical protein